MPSGVLPMTKDRQTQERNQQELERRLERIERHFGMSLLQQRLRSRQEALAAPPDEPDSSESQSEL